MGVRDSFLNENNAGGYGMAQRGMGGWCGRQ